MDNSLSSAFKKQAGFKNKKPKAGAASAANLKQPVHQSQIPPPSSFTSAEVSYGGNESSPFTIDEIDNIVTATTAAANESHFKRVEKSKDINEVFANFASNSPAYFSQLDGPNG